jgi:hypothetical protein
MTAGAVDRIRRDHPRRVRDLNRLTERTRQVCGHWREPDERVRNPDGRNRTDMQWLPIVKRDVF